MHAYIPRNEKFEKEWNLSINEEMITQRNKRDTFFKIRPHQLAELGRN